MGNFIKNEDIIKYLSKAKAVAVIFGFFSLFFLGALFFIDAKENAHRDIVSVIGVTEEKIYKDAQFSLDFSAYDLSEEAARKKIDDKVVEIKKLIENFDQITIGEVEKKVTIDCIINSQQYYQVQALEKGECLTNNWRAQSRIKVTIKGDKYSEEIKKKFLSLAPSIVDATSGPFFIKKDLDEEFQNILLENAMANAKKKASKMASESNKKLGEVIRINENPVVKNNLMSIQSEEKQVLGPGEDLVKKQISVEYELKK
ncbi:MAG: SIMPL domain-containing protein [Candidatus Moranbacteria bacterium]|nr:SIMPL domain-containing protein [Candidatus Moranbacteria bacterium]